MLAVIDQAKIKQSRLSLLISLSDSLALCRSAQFGSFNSEHTGYCTVVSALTVTSGALHLLDAPSSQTPHSTLEMLLLSWRKLKPERFCGMRVSGIFTIYGFLELFHVL